MSDWTEWTGGKCPVDGRTIVEAGFRDGSNDVLLAMSIRWDHRHSESDVLRWRAAPRVGDYALLDSTESKPTNPKDIIGGDKLPLHLWPTTATALGSLALLDGCLKYGRSNFRVMGVRSSIYYDAALRHLMAWFEGEDSAPDSGLPHLGHALACLAIIVDAQAVGKLNDDRMVHGGFHTTVDAMTQHVARLKALHADKAPKHFNISDNEV